MSLVCVMSDTQFDEQLSYATIGEDGVSSRLTDAIACFDWIVDTALSRGCKRLIHLGDVFDSRTSIDVSVLDRVGRAFGRAHGLGLEMDLLAGNHDSYLRSSAINSLAPFAGMATIHDLPSTDGRFGFIPWVEDDDVFVEQVQCLVGQKKVEYLFTHCMVEGAVPKALGVGRPLAMLRPERWRQVVLGDVHDPVVVAKNVRYCGSPMQWHYGDAGGKRGFLILDDEKGTIEFVENTLSPRFHLVTEAKEASPVREHDYVRLRVEDPDERVAVRAALDGLQPRQVEEDRVELDMSAPRLSIHARDAHEDILRRFVEHQGFAVDADDLVALGLDLLEEARNA